MFPNAYNILLHGIIILSWYEYMHGVSQIPIQETQLMRVQPVEKLRCQDPMLLLYYCAVMASMMPEEHASQSVENGKDCHMWAIVITDVIVVFQAVVYVVSTAVVIILSCIQHQRMYVAF